MKTVSRFYIPVLTTLLAVLPWRLANPCSYIPPSFTGYHLTDMGALQLPAIPDTYQVLSTGRTRHRPYFSQLALDFQGTKAYDSFIRECSEFEDFVSNTLGRR